MRNMRVLSGCPAWKRKTLVLMGALSILLIVGVFAAACGGGTGGGYGTPATTAGAATTAGTGGTAGTSTTVGASTTASTPATTGGGGGAKVVIKNFAFDQTSVTIKAGESVTWTNQDSVTHHLVGDKGEFDSADLAAGATFTFTFKTAGTVAYHCSIHPSMTGTVVVQ